MEVASDTTSGTEVGVEEAVRNRKNNGPRKAIGNLWDNIKGAFKGNKKDIFVLKVKSILYPIIAVLVFFALIIEGNAEDTSSVATSSAASYYEDSTTESAELYNSTGSLILATEEELEEITNNYLEKLENTNEGYYNALSAKYSGKDSSSVANKVAHITSNYEAGETEEVDIISQKATSVSGAASAKDEKTIYEHILSTEKYNFNNIIWRSYVKSGSGVKSADMSFRVDNDSKLKYPVSDSNATNNDDLDLEFFITKIRPYLQSWYIPFDIMVGTQDAQSTSNLNTDLAYEIITSAYHEIVLDRYKIENLERTTNYLVYDKTTTTTKTQRTCADYEYTTTEDEVEKEAGENCTKQEYNNGLCKDAKRELDCQSWQVSTKVYGCRDYGDKINCDDYPKAQGCTYGVLKKDKIAAKNTTTTNTYCTDTTLEPDVDVEQDIRESKVKDKKDTDKLTYSWNYVISMAKMLDKVISNKYTFEAYYEYSLDNYNNFINKTGDYKDMTVEKFRESEKGNSKADEFISEDADYNVVEDPVTDNTNSDWNKDKVVTEIPAGGTKVGTATKKTIKKVVEVTKVGKEYTDKYNWSDTLKFDESKSGIYNVDSVTDVTGNDLSYSDEEYYKAIYDEQELNLIDLMNSDNTVYENYLEKEKLSSNTTNIGIRKSALDISYNVLKKDLREVAEKYPVSGLMYGNSLDILEGMNLAAIVAAGSTNEALLNLALSYEGNYLTDMMAIDDCNIFWKDQWCAMFVSFCMRKLEKLTSTQIPIPTYFSCTRCWNSYHDKPGFFDVQEWVDSNPGASNRNTNPANIAPLSSIQPGDLILFSWVNDKNPGNRDHTALVKSVEKDEQGNVTCITTIDGNWGSGGRGFNYSKVTSVDHKGFGKSYYDLRSIASFISVSTVLAEAEQGNTWK